MCINKYFKLPVDNGFTESWLSFRQGQKAEIAPDQGKAFLWPFERETPVK